MRKSDGSIIYSPTDLVRFMESPFASWMERLHLECPGRVTPDELGEDAKLIAKTGDEHEEKFLQKLQDDGLDIADIPKNDFEKALKLTKEAICGGRGVIYQGALARDSFAGFTDFIVRDESGSYEIWDTKLARSAKPYHLIQLCAYAEMLEPLNGRLPERIRVVLGDNTTSDYRTENYFQAYLRLKESFLSQMESFDPDLDAPIPEPRAEHRQWSSHAEKWLTDRDHLVQVAGIQISQIRKLNAAGVNTMADLAACDLPRIGKLKDEVYQRLRDQARLQLKAKDLPEGEAPPYEILYPDESLPHSGLAMLPPSSEGDVYFDIEGYPLVGDGLEYLLGATHLVDGSPEFDDWWAHDEAQERASFEGFIDWVMERWEAYPDMHIYHYAPYEVTAMKRLMGKYGTREHEVDCLLRNGVFIDLYRVVQHGIRLGASSYSLKKVEKLYLDPREGDVQDAAASIVFYADWLESGEPEQWEQSPILKKIRDYNKDDCDSTWMLADWLRSEQTENDIPYCVPNGSDGNSQPQKEAPESAQESMRLVSAMHAKISSIPEEADERVIGELLAHFVEFHRRDDKPMWWSMFERSVMTEEELFEDINCLAGLELDGSPVKEKRSLIATYRYNPDQDSKISAKSRVIMSNQPGVKFQVVGLDLIEGSIQVKTSQAALDKNLEGSFPERLSVIPDEHVSAGVIEQALKDLAQTWLDHGDVPPCLERLLLRQPPKIEGAEEGNQLGSPADVVPLMDESTLAIQGPPGTGKTYTASRLIKDLIESGKRVGITSNSRKAIINLIEGVHDAGADLTGSVYSSSDPADTSLQHIPGISIFKSSDALDCYSKGIIAGTAWLFSRPEFASQLDYLFVDEAGQVALANVAAMSQCTRNLVLLGDQNQLPMPTQGTHPGESGLSSLVYLLKGHSVVPRELGVFLGTTYRMHPDVCQFISDSFYESELKSDSSTSKHIIEVPEQPGLVAKESGILLHPVPHTGNTQSSEEEVVAIIEMLGDLIGRKFTNSKGESQTISLDDILFVCPYNMQVRLLEKALPEGAKVGSVDRFQGQEAPVVIFSMCSSAGDFGNRGLGFILDPNRLNVALSRAQALAIVVADPNIASTDAGSIKELGLINTFCRLTRHP